jgi:hypothetical protein
MKKFSGSVDIYNELVENSGIHWLMGLVAFAVIEEKRIEWMKHQTAHNGNMPSFDEIEKWYEQLPEGELLRAKDTAESRLKDYSSEVIESFGESYRKEIEEGIIVSEIKDGRKFWPQFGVNLAGGIASSIIMAIIIILFAFLVINDTSPVSIGDHLKSKLKMENYHGEKGNN